MIEKPHDLVEAELILSLCQRFGCLPSQLLAEDAEILKLLLIEQLGTPPDLEGGADGGW